MDPNAIAQLAEHFISEWSPGEPAAAVSQVSAGAVVAFLLYRFLYAVVAVVAYSVEATARAARADEGTGPDLTLSVRNTGDRLAPGPVENGVGTGLSRLRERLAFLYGDAARLTCRAREDGGFEAVLVVPRSRREA